MDKSISNYITLLVDSTNEAAARHEAEEAQRRQEEAEAYAQRMTPLVDRLRRVIDSMPEPARHQPYPIEFFAEKLKGRQSQTPNRGELGAALRALGFTRTRSWQEPENGFRSTWQFQQP